MKEKVRTSKSKHKHLYEPCLLKDDSNGLYSRGEYCSICGKIGKVNYLESVPSERPGFSRLLTSNEIKEKYKDLKTFTIKSILEDKYVTL